MRGKEDARIMLTLQHRERIAAAKRGRRRELHDCAAISAALTGKKKSATHRLHLSQSLKATWQLLKSGRPHLLKTARRLSESPTICAVQTPGSTQTP